MLLTYKKYIYDIFYNGYLNLNSLMYLIRRKPQRYPYLSGIHM